MGKEIKITCAGSTSIPYTNLFEFQGQLKELSKDNYTKLKNEILTLGFTEPISVWDDNGKFWILNGHQRLRTIRQMVEEENYKCPDLPVSIVLAKDKEEASRKVLALTSQYGEITKDGLYKYSVEHGITPQELESRFRFPEINLKNWKLEFFEDDRVEEELPPVPVEPKTKIGDLYKLGDHRLLCGDAKDKDSIKKLMDGSMADLLWTDPPYGVSYTEKNEFLNSIGKAMACPNAIQNDSESPNDMAIFWEQVLSNSIEFMSNKSSYYIASTQGGDLMMMMMSINRAGFQIKHTIIWVKNNHVLGRCDYNYKHEPILYGWKQGGTHEFFGQGRCKTSVWEFNKPLKNDLHPTMKPVELIEEAILNSSRENQNVLDMFGGSGSTLIACEKTKRKCFMLEIDPAYCDIIVERWEKFTGQKSELIK